MRRSGPLPLTFEGPEQGFRGKNCQNGSRKKPWMSYFLFVTAWRLILWSKQLALKRSNILSLLCLFELSKQLVPRL